jgi:hypothetical protein
MYRHFPIAIVSCSTTSSLSVSLSAVQHKCMKITLYTLHMSTKMVISHEMPVCLCKLSSALYVPLCIASFKVRRANMKLLAVQCHNFHSNYM